MVVCNRYATSFFELAKEENLLDTAFSDIVAISQALKDNKDLLNVLCSPIIKAEDKNEIILKVFKDEIHEYTKNFLMVLNSKKRINLFFDIALEFEKIYNIEMGIEKAVITTAIEFSDAEKESLLEKLSAKQNKKIKAEFKVDASILGGVIVSFDNKLIDGSVKAKLDNINKQM